MRNNPINLIDPTGMSWTGPAPDIWGGGGGGGGDIPCVLCKEKPPTEEDKEDIEEKKKATPINEEDPDDPQNKEAYNCHSYCFHDSKGDPTDPRNDSRLPKWDNYPDDDLKEQGFKKLDPNEPNKPGDVVIYGNDKDENGSLEGDEITHSARVTEVDGEGNTTRVEGKWGQLPVYEHHPAVAPARYGSTREYRRD